MWSKSLADDRKRREPVERLVFFLHVFRFHAHVLLPLHALEAILVEPIADSEEVTALWASPHSRLTVTGECGDQIFGSQLLEAAFVPTELQALYERGLDAGWEETFLESLLELGVVKPERKAAWLRWFRCADRRAGRGLRGPSWSGRPSNSRQPSICGSEKSEGSKTEGSGGSTSLASGRP